MTINKLKESVTLYYVSDLSKTRDDINSILIRDFKRIGLIGTFQDDKSLFRKIVQSDNIRSRADLIAETFKIIRTVDAKFYSKNYEKLELELSTDLTHLFILSIAVAICFCLGFIFFIDRIGIINYTMTAFIIMFLMLTSGLLYIKSVTSQIFKNILSSHRTNTQPGQLG